MVLSKKRKKRRQKKLNEQKNIELILKKGWGRHEDFTKIKRRADEGCCIYERI